MRPIFIFLFVYGSSMLYAHTIDEKILQAFRVKCMVCHDLYEKNTKAPPLVAVNQVYLRLAGGDGEDATKHMKAFLTVPSTKRALMKPAVKLYGIMPKMKLTKKEISDYAQVLIETEFEVPEWFDKHYEKHELKKPH